MVGRFVKWKKKKNAMIGKWFIENISNVETKEPLLGGKKCNFQIYGSNTSQKS